MNEVLDELREKDIAVLEALCEVDRLEVLVAGVHAIPPVECVFQVMIGAP